MHAVTTACLFEIGAQGTSFYVVLTFFENAALHGNCRHLVDSVLEVGVKLLSGDLSVIHKGVDIIWLF